MPYSRVMEAAALQSRAVHCPSMERSSSWVSRASTYSSVFCSSWATCTVWPARGDTALSPCTRITAPVSSTCSSSLPWEAMYHQLSPSDTAAAAACSVTVMSTPSGSCRRMLTERI